MKKTICLLIFTFFASMQMFATDYSNWSIGKLYGLLKEKKAKIDWARIRSEQFSGQQKRELWDRIGQLNKEKWDIEQEIQKRGYRLQNPEKPPFVDV